MKQRSENIISMLKNFKRFTDLMLDKILENLYEKGVSFRNMDNNKLIFFLGKYLERKDYISVANICFMITENEGKI